MEVRDNPDAELHQRLAMALGHDAVLTSVADRSAYALDALRESMLPSAVVLPRTAEDVAKAVRIAIELEQPIIPRGGGTSLTGASAPIGGGLVISLLRMNRILKIDARRRTARVQPGVLTLDVSYAAAPYGLFYAADPASERVATLGGNLATDACGPHAFAYGRTNDQVLSIEYVDAQGNIQHTSVDDKSFDLCGLFAGSEGTLGIVTALDLSLRRAPESIRVGLATFTDINGAIEAATLLRQQCGAVVALELLDDIALNAIAGTIESPYPPDAKAVLLVEFAGLVEETHASVKTADTVLSRTAATTWFVARTSLEAQRLWLGRREVRRCLGQVSPDVDIHDVAVPRAALPQLVSAIHAISERHQVRIALIGHVGDGCMHPVVLFDRADARQRQSAFLIGNELLEAAISLGGGAGEYGIGTAKRALVHKNHTEDERTAQRLLRCTFDSMNLLNPEKLVPFAAVEDA
jgi:glycolate oxidase